MEREPIQYSRLLVLAGLVPLLLLDLFVGLPEGAFVGVGAVVLAAAAGVHFYGGERLAGAGWLLFGAALGLVAVVDVTGGVLVSAAFAGLLLAGLLLLLAEQRVGKRSET